MYQFDPSDYLSIEDILRLFNKNWQSDPDIELIDIEQSVGRICAEDVLSILSIPVVRSSKVDGIAIHSNDFANKMPDTSQWIEGKNFAYVDTGDDFDDQFDAVIMIEDVKIKDNSLLFCNEMNIKKGELIYSQGSFCKQDDVLIKKGKKITPFDLSGLAMGGITRISVYKKPKIAFIPTGNELVSAGMRVQRGQIVDSNSLLVKGFVTQWGAEALLYPIIRDVKSDLEKTLQDAKEHADIVLINGGSSKGQEDFCTDLVKENATFFQHYVKAAPGRPIAVSVVNNQPIINIPGPTNATFFVLHWCIRALINQYYQYEPLASRKVSVKMKNSLIIESKIDVCVWCHVTKENGEYVAIGYTKENKLSELIEQANAYTVLSAHSHGYTRGDYLDVIWIDPTC